MSRSFTFLACPDCAGITVLEHDLNPANGRVYATWPEDGERTSDVNHLPSDVEEYYKDARKVLDAGVPAAAAVQLRKTLEAAAAHYGKTDRVLVRRIEALIEDGLVTPVFAEVLTLIRVVGNQGAHAGDEQVDHATANQALRFTTQLLRNLFEVPGEIEEMKRSGAVEVSGPPEEPGETVVV